jgi:predicted phosphohydrolase
LWTSAERVRRALPPGCEILHNDAARFEDWVVVGARGWTRPDDPQATPQDVAVFQRELARLELSIGDADRRFGRELPRVAVLHYPPLVEGQGESEVSRRLVDAGVLLAAYGHLHGADHRFAVQGRRGGLYYCFVAADAVGFEPMELPLAELDRERP